MTKRTVPVIILLVIILIISLSFLIKSDSTLGRMLIYKVSWNMFADHFITGIGSGNFQTNYNLYQAAYFKAGHYTEKEFLLADSVFFAFNDYWQFIIEFGLIGLVLMIAFSVIGFMVIKKALKTYPSNHFIKLMVSLFLIVCTAAWFNHVFERRVLQVFIAICLAWFVYVNYYRKNNPRFYIIIFIFFCVGFTIFKYSNDIFNLRDYHKFEKAKLLSSIGYKLESQKLYNEIYPKLKDDAGFLIYYCDEFFDYKDSKSVLTDYLLLAKKRTDYKVYLKLALIYEKLKQNGKAEEMYVKSVYMVPNRFSSRLALFNFYLSTDNLLKAQQLGDFTLKMPIKVPSDRVKYIKNKISRKLTK